MTDVLDVANYILEISREESEDGEFELISHMKLQKLVYFTQGFSLALFNRPLFSEPIEAWKHGPVCPKLYHILKVYGAAPITAVFDPEKIALNNDEKLLIKMVYDNYGQYSASRLRKLTHDDGPWSTAMINTVITQEDMSNYFLSLVDVNPANMSESTDDEKKELLSILEQADADGELDMSQFCLPMGT
ncbi:MAG: DUF4065 domain-containing protein [Treponema sp.]|nr:DUF4065 domain-containing protein [Treponema sp.]